MDKNELVSLFHKELRYEAQTPGYIREETEHVVRHISEFGESGFIIASNVNNDNVKAVIKNELNYFNNLKQDFEWKVYSYDKPDHLKELLEQEGFTGGEPEALMVMKLAGTHTLLMDSQLLDVKEITDEQGIQHIVDLEDAIWNESHEELGKRLWRDKQSSPDTLYLYGIYEEEQLVSAAWMYLEANSSFASLWGGSTLPLFRGKGYYTKLLAARAQKAYEKGHPFLTVDASPMSKPILEKCGFDCLAYSYGYQSPDTK
ncbi:GNAT family N-acetyltransferase [Solibacillus sp. MA9]|uniref:GNAT family N-acetyltransferase n=1 Tax=Solibacillus palustris TaxID=2908203 RepID=A0ABS9UHV2_9BACL|nr:GNAT family N-acetyltransferase [Solibacillus sp. MA9]MCH7323928.1 GNAT family N-acetyltransferase [Solibacillus sp. MA9]